MWTRAVFIDHFPTGASLAILCQSRLGCRVQVRSAMNSRGWKRWDCQITVGPRRSLSKPLGVNSSQT